MSKGGLEPSTAGGGTENFFLEFIFFKCFHFPKKKNTEKKGLACVPGWRLELPTFRSERGMLCHYATKTFGLYMTNLAIQTFVRDVTIFQDSTCFFSHCAFQKVQSCILR